MKKSAMVAAPLAAILVLVSCLLPSATGSGDGYPITVAWKIEGMGSKGIGLPAKISNIKVILNGGQRVSFVQRDGYFSFYNVPAGTHLIEVTAPGYFFSPVRVDISARNPGNVQAALTENKRALQELVLEPLAEEKYYETREPFSVMSLVKSPMGLMVGFMLIVMFVMPKLVENMDPEEIKKAQEEMRSQGGLAGMLTGAATGATRSSKMDGEEGRASTSGRKERRAGEQHELLLEPLRAKLRSIEEDTNSLKRDVTGCVEERSMLMSEIAGHAASLDQRLFS
ncbi:uncharacterized protein A4U43_C01F1120 [Asparagus officinalis]|uniref:ER membrane protein complex subunit 7 beta-sandwich domain-containing protein n=1 Tax=Asparagus officinalis TaxID=4686 RepID=A0A5P1FQE2_ASPOF|nr:uncharacterized protein A4U43_C01F1120 [Asparagus officinalis]